MTKVDWGDLTKKQIEELETITNNGLMTAEWGYGKCGEVKDREIENQSELAYAVELCEGKITKIYFELRQTVTESFDCELEM